jgi:hypothetical protein
VNRRPTGDGATNSVQKIPRPSKNWSLFEKGMYHIQIEFSYNHYTNELTKFIKNLFFSFDPTPSINKNLRSKS